MLKSSSTRTKLKILALYIPSVFLKIFYIRTDRFLEGQLKRNSNQLLDGILHNFTNQSIRYTLNTIYFIDQNESSQGRIQRGAQGARPPPQTLVINDRDTLIEQSVTLIKQSQCLLGNVVYL